MSPFLLLWNTVLIDFNYEFVNVLGEISNDHIASQLHTIV